MTLFMRVLTGMCETSSLPNKPNHLYTLSDFLETEYVTEVTKQIRETFPKTKNMYRV